MRGVATVQPALRLNLFDDHSQELRVASHRVAGCRASALYEQAERVASNDRIGLSLRELERCDLDDACRGRSRARRERLECSEVISVDVMSCGVVSLERGSPDHVAYNSGVGDPVDADHEIGPGCVPDRQELLPWDSANRGITEREHCMRASGLGGRIADSSCTEVDALEDRVHSIALEADVVEEPWIFPRDAERVRGICDEHLIIGADWNSFEIEILVDDVEVAFGRADA
jgi:hypothetical protein